MNENFTDLVRKKFNVSYWFPGVPQESAKPLENTLIYSNLLRLRLVSWPIIVTQLVLAIILVKTITAYGWIPPGILIGILFIFRYTSNLPHSPEGITRRHHFYDIVMLPFILGMYIFYAVFFMVNHVPGTLITPSMGSIIAIFSSAVFLYTNWPKSVILYGLTTAILIISGWKLLPEPAALVNTLNLTFVAVISVIMSRMIYIMRVHDFLKQKLIDQQREALIQVNNTLFKLSLIDNLTSIPNRRYFDEILHREWDRAVREKSELALLMIDIDFFKQYNDNFGHLAGDLILIKIAEILNAAVNRPGDMVFRYGGDEFAVILPNTGLNGAILVAGRLSEAVNRKNIAHSFSPHTRITISIGLTSYSPKPGEGVRTLLTAADDALYKSKHSGRNTISCNSPGAVSYQT